MKRKLVILILATYSLSIVALSQKRGAENSPCEGAGGTQAEANACARHQFKQADARLNQVYDRLMSELSGYGSGGKDQEKLKQAQSVWLQYRNANCESEASIFEGGSIHPTVYYTCLASMTFERTRRIRAYLAVTRQ